MLEFLYPYSYLACLLSLILWFYFSEKPLAKLMQGIFFGGFLIYILSLFLSPSLLSVKFFSLFRGLLILALLANFFKFFRKNKLVFFAMLVILLAAFYFKGKYFLQSDLKASGTEALKEQEVFEDGELLLDIKEGTDISALSNLLAAYDLTYEVAFHPNKKDITELDDYWLLNIPEKHEHKWAEIIERLEASPLVDDVELNEVFNINPIIPKRRTPPVEVEYQINDPEVHQQWGLDVMKTEKLYALLNEKQIKPKRKANVFIIDSGIDAGHEDLKDRYRSINKEYDRDSNGHGTHCAGIAAAVTNNGLGIASVFPDNSFVNLSGIKVMNFMGLITQQRLIEGVIEAVDRGADVISISIGSRSREASQEAFQKVVEYAQKANAIIVVAAGNDNLSAIEFTPANASGVITVSAINQNVQKAYFSNTVNDVKMGIAAPGVDIYSTFPKSQYKALSGTSMACPQVAGLIGLMRSIKPELSTEKAYGILNQTGKRTADGNQTGKLIQPAEAINALLK